MMKLAALTVTGLVAVAFADEASDIELEHFRLLNDLRRKGFTCPNGASYAPNNVPLKFDCRLWKASQLHSQDMGEQRYFSHTSKDGRSPWARAEAQGVSASGENIAAGNSGAQAVLDQWANSDGHCRNMMNPSQRVIGIGRAYVSGSPYRYYWTQMFGRDSQLASLDESCLESGPVPTPAPTPRPVTNPTAAPATDCKSIKDKDACDSALACAAKVKKGKMKKCLKAKCKTFKDENSCILVEHCSPKMKKGKFQKCASIKK